MAPIRVGFIGLSSSGWAKGAHFPFLKESDKYEIVALCNSSVESAKEAIKSYELPSTTKAYGDPEELAKDENVDLVVCSVRVDRHFATISPSLKAGKNVFVEWPLGKNLTEAKELLRLKNENGIKTAVVGLQGRQATSVKKIKELIEGGRIGEVLSSTWQGQGTNAGPTVTEGREYISDRTIGGNLVTIHFGHSIDYIQHVLGYGFTPAAKTLVANRRKTQTLLDKDGKVLDSNFPKTSDDTIFLHGYLTSGIPISYTLRGGIPFKDTPGLDWRIYGLNGEIRVTASGPFLQVGYPDVKIQVHDVEKGTVEDVKIEEDDVDALLEGYGIPSKNVGRRYRELSEGRNNCSFEDAAERHGFIEEIYRENGIVDF